MWLRWVFVVGCSMCALSASANTRVPYPAKPVRMVVPLAPGGGSDIVARVVAQALAGRWGQGVVVDNRPGAGGTLGSAIVARAAADGYTLLVTSTTLAIAPALYRNPDAEAVKQLAPLSLLADQPSVLAINGRLAATSLPELLAMMKAQPGKLAFGSTGVGTASHLANELFTATAGVKALHIPYKSAGLAATALLAG
ncbi:MAG: tripartite tricarboxylate transporter substrate binding protein, partial [Betaproteobacteria bacterium]|nr:tripartite tricarboxylate transporter substrate binding protein [Betaproteobacteria bacterium]